MCQINSIFPSFKVLIVSGLTSAGLTGEVKSYDLYSGQWITLQPLTYPRRSHACTHYKKADGSETVVVAGGITFGGDKTASVEIYDVASDTWGQGPGLPAATSHFNLVNIGALGGRVGDPAMTSDLIQVMRDDLSGWEVHEVKIPNGGFFSAAVAVYNE